jgi:hypothetical protein
MAWQVGVAGDKEVGGLDAFWLRQKVVDTTHL